MRFASCGVTLVRFAVIANTGFGEKEVMPKKSWETKCLFKNEGTSTRTLFGVGTWMSQFIGGIQVPAIMRDLRGCLK